MTMSGNDLLGNFVGDSGLVAIIATAVVLLATVVFFFVYRSCSSKADTILLIGLSDAGKTTMFTKLINSKNGWQTYMSMTANCFTQYLTKNGDICVLVDVPGAESVRKNILLKWLIKERHAIKCIVFVIDSTSFVQKCKDAAELLYDVIYDSNCSIPILVACNKQDDQLKAKTAKSISMELEKEFGLINLSRISSLSSTSGDTAPNVLTSGGEKFSWTDLKKRAGRPLVTFAECSAAEERTIEADTYAKLSINAVRNWIESF